MRAFLAKDPEHVLLPDKAAPLLPPECFQAEDAEHAGVTAPGPADAAEHPSV